jgi:hypothetical protein
VRNAPQCLCKYGFAFVPEFGKEFAQEYIQLMGEDISHRKKEIIAGGVEQYAMPLFGRSPWVTHLRSKWHTLVAKLALYVGVDPDQLHLLLSIDIETDSSKKHSAYVKLQLHVQDEKLLLAGRQKGGQGPHIDRHDSAENLKQVYTVILYLTDGVDSTAFPKFPLSEFALPEFNLNGEIQNSAAMRATVERRCLEEDQYDRWPVYIGDMAIFTQATMVCVHISHFGCGCSQCDYSFLCVCVGVCVSMCVLFLLVPFDFHSALWYQEQYAARAYGIVQCTHTVQTETSG